MIREYTDEELINVLKEEYIKNPNFKHEDFKVKNGLPRYALYFERFGSWNNAKEIAEIPCNNKRLKSYEYSKETLTKSFRKIVFDIGYVPKFIDLDNYNDFPSSAYIYKHFNNYPEFISACGFEANKEYRSKYTDSFLLGEIKRFVKEFSRTPSQDDFENLDGYPSRKTFANHFGSFNEAIHLAGYKPNELSKREKSQKHDKQFLLNTITDYVLKYKKTPTLIELHKEVGYEIRTYFRKTFGGYNNALKELKLPLNAVSQYEDSFLESEFHRFVQENGRVPVISEFNASEYPSFWCYQHRFGSWNKAVVSYGYEPNDLNRKYILDSGEICASSYEFDISTWLNNYNFSYNRDVDYINFIENYKGKMNCDYVINYNNKIWYVEMAGFLSDTTFAKLSLAERKYFFKLEYKIKLLKRQGLNYLIIKPRDLKRKTLGEIFSVVFDGGKLNN